MYSVFSKNARDIYKYAAGSTDFSGNNKKKTQTQITLSYLTKKFILLIKNTGKSTNTDTNVRLLHGR